MDLSLLQKDTRQNFLDSVKSRTPTPEEVGALVDYVQYLEVRINRMIAKQRAVCEERDGYRIECSLLETKLRGVAENPFSLMEDLFQK